MPFNRREIFYEQQFLDELYAIEADRRKADLFIEGVELYLVYAPETGIRITPHSPVWFISTSEIANFPRLMVFYTFNSTYVYCLSIKHGPL